MNSRKDTYYFSHDTNAKDDPKCVLLIEQLGMEGYGIFWVLIETLRDQPDYKYPVANISALARRYNTTTEKVRAVIYGYELFIVEDELFFYSDSLNRRMESYNLLKSKRSESGRLGNAKRWGTSQNDRNAITEQSQTIAIKEKESKVKDNKERDTNKRFTPPTFEEVNSYIVQKGYSLSAQSFIDYYTSNGWMVGRTKMKDWRSAINSWARRDATAPGNSQTTQRSKQYGDL